MLLNRTGRFACLLALSVSVMLIASVRECASHEDDEPKATSAATNEGISPNDGKRDETTMDETVNDAGDGAAGKESLVEEGRGEVADSDRKEKETVIKIKAEKVSEERPGDERPPDREGAQGSPKRKKITKAEKAAEKMRKARILFADIDTDKDKNVEPEEIQQWVERTQEKAINDQLGAEWEAFNTDGDFEVTWAEYRTGTLQRAGVSLDDDSDKKTATDILALEWGRFEAADRDRDGTLSKEEFRAAIFPHEYSYMVDQMVNEMLKEVDKNSDELVSLEEYRGMFADLMEAQERGVMFAFEEQIRKYHKEHDSNGDGLLNAAEMRPMVTEDRSNRSVQETNNLLSNADRNKNGVLDHDEFIAKYGDFKSFLRNTEYRPFLDEEEEMDLFDDDDDDDEDDDEDFDDLSDDFGLDDDDEDEDERLSKDTFDFDEEEILKELQRDEL